MRARERQPDHFLDRRILDPTDRLRGMRPAARRVAAGASSRRTSSTAFGKWKLFTSPNAAQRLRGDVMAVAAVSSEYQLDPFGARDPRHQDVERSVVQQAAAVDHQYSRRERGYVLHVMRREQYRRAVPVAGTR